ncbi:hypothetical protein [Micromonospora sp. B006]|uniref:effector-associated constant component EACC1 n=1 Tax=Micromonospora sp. B006 TaxID=2201999 RepID=UPI0012602CDB|nr:hypothetical protein [Micromonospora sp. B006]
MRVEVAWLDDTEGELAELETYLRQDPRLDDVRLQRGRPTVPAGALGVVEVLEFVASNVSLGLVVNALWDFARGRLRRQETRLLLTRTDLADRARQVEIDFTGSAEAAERIARDALADGP